MTSTNGDAFKIAFGMGAGGLTTGRTLRYNTRTSDNKIAAAFNMAGEFTMDIGARALLAPTIVSARATQTVTVNPFVAGQDKVTGMAEASVQRGGGQPALAIAIVNDPVQIALLDPNLTGRVEINIGTDLDRLLLEATAPGDFAAVVYELGRKLPGLEPEPLITFTIGMDFYTQSLQQTITILQFNPALGFANENAFQDYLLSPVNNFLSFDPGAHRLMSNKVIPLLPFDLSTGTSPIVITYNYEAIASSVPEPSTVVLLASGLAGMALFRRQRRGKQVGLRRRAPMTEAA
jgi:hypothetical protein